MSLFLLLLALMDFALRADSGLSPTLLRAAAYFNAGADTLPSSFSLEEEPAASGRANWEAISRLISTSTGIFITVNIIVALLLLLTGTAALWNVMGKLGHRIELWWAFFLLLAWSGLQIQIVRWASLLQGLGMIARCKRMEAFFGLVRLLFMSLALITGMGVPGLMFAATGVAVAQLSIMRRAVLSLEGLRGIRRAGFDKNLFMQLWPPTWRLGIVSWGSYLIYNGPSLIAAQLKDIATISAFLLSLRAVYFLRQVSQVPLRAYFPEAVRALATGRILAFRNLTAKIVSLTLACFVTGSLLFILLGNPSLQLIGSKTSLSPTPILALLSLCYFFDVHHTVHGALYMASNHVPFASPSMLSGMAILGLGYLASMRFGVTGIVVVQLAVQGACNNWYPVFLSLRLTRWRFSSYVRSLADFGKTDVWAAFKALVRKEVTPHTF